MDDDPAGEAGLQARGAGQNLSGHGSLTCNEARTEPKKFNEAVRLERAAEVKSADSNGEIADRLMTLGNGAALAVSGKAEINGWLDKQGEPRAGLSLVVDEVATLKGKPLPPQGAGDAPNVRQGQGSPQRPQRPTRQPVAAGAGFDDDLPDCFS
jgi:hypothetical protein